MDWRSPSPARPPQPPDVAPNGPPASPVGFTRPAPYQTLDAWRGVAALWVVMVHSCLPYILNGHSSLLRQPVYFLSVWGQLGVVIFFVISGYCITGAAFDGILRDRSVRSFCTNRLRRIYPPYLAAMFFALALLIGTRYLQAHHLLPVYRSSHFADISGASQWLANLTLTQVPTGKDCWLVVAWSLSYEVAFYVVIACLLAMGLCWGAAHTSRRMSVLSMGIGVTTCGSLAWLCVSPATCPFPLGLWYQFGLGALLFLDTALGTSRTWQSLRSMKVALKILTLSALVLTCIYAESDVARADGAQPSLGHPSTCVQAVATLVFLACLHVLRPFDARLIRSRGVVLFTHLGSFSYSLYLVHLPLLPYVDAGLRRMGFDGQGYFLVYLVQLAVALVAGKLFFLGVERRFISARQAHRIALE